MFNKKLKLENKVLKKEIEAQKIIIEKLRQELALPLPKDCKKGDYCQACAFSISVRGHIPYCGNYDYLVCGKDRCKEFVGKEEN